MQCYNAYGLTIASSVEIPEMPEAGDCDPQEADIVIRLGTVPDELDDSLAQAKVYQASASELLLEIEDVGRYLVSHGREVTIEPAPTATSHDVRVFLLGTCFGALLHQRGALVLHASGVGTARGAVLFAGASGAGKSTLLAELMRRGYKMMVDDVTAITRDPQNGGELVVMPSYARTRLWADAAAHLDVDTTNFRRTRTHMDKYERHVPDQFWDQPASLRKIYCLAMSKIEQLDLSPLPAMAVPAVILNHTYRKMFLDPFGMREHHFDLSSDIARSVPVSWAIRPLGSFRVSELADMIIEDLDGE
jgi:hypothetical protein